MASTIQIIGHSFVTRLKRFIRDNPSFKFNLNLSSNPLVQYSGFSGANVHTLRDNLSDVTDFNPDIAVLIIGTNDLYSVDTDPMAVTMSILDLVDRLLFMEHVQFVIVMQILHRQPACKGRYKVDTEWFNSRVDDTNLLLSSKLQQLPHNRATFWRLKGFWSGPAQQEAFVEDGVHLSTVGHKKLYHNIRAAVVSVMNRSLQH